MNKTIARVCAVAVVLLLISTFGNAATCTGGSGLSGYYGMLVGGAGKYLTGALHFDGNCNITGTNIAGTLGGSYVTTTATGTYGQNSDSTYTLTLNFSGQSAAQTYIVGVSESGNKARGIESDGTAGDTIDLQSQLAPVGGGYTSSSLNGTYAAACLTSGAADLNYVTFDGNGLTGVDVFDNGGTNEGNNSYSGTYSVNSDGTFSGTLTGSYSSFSFNGVIENGVSQIEYIYDESGSGGVLSCVGKQSTSNSLQGYYGLLIQGTAQSGSGGKYLSGSAYFNGGSISVTNLTGGSSGGLGTTYSTTTATGTYAVNSNNTVTITLNIAGQSTPQTFIVGVAEGGNEALGVESDGTAIASIDLQAQLQLPASSYNAASLNGTYSASCSGSEYDLNYVNFAGNGTLSGVDPYYDGSYGDSPYTGNYTVNSDGTFSATFAGTYDVFTLDGVIDNGNSEIEYTYLESGTGGVVGCIGESIYGAVVGQTTPAAPTTSPAPGTYGTTQSVTLADSTSGATIHYTTNGSTPTVNSPVYSGAIQVAATTTIEAVAISSSGSVSAITAATYFITAGLPTAAAPTFNETPGTYASAQTITLADSTAGATIYYTTNGTTPNSNSAVYSPSSPIAVNTTTTIEAFAAVSGYGNSSVTIGTYTIGTQTTTAAEPTFGQNPGTYSGTQTITLSDTTPGATIYYTTNGSTPTNNSSVYNPSSPITVNSTMTIEAIAEASGYNNSPVLSGTFTITQGSGTATPVNLSSYYNAYGIEPQGTSPRNGGFDGDGYAYNASLLGSSLSYQGVTFPVGASNAADAITGATVPLPAGSYGQLYLLGAGVNGAQSNQSIVVTYTDGSTSTFTQTLSDWCHYSGFSGESLVAQMATRIVPGGGTQSGTINVYGYTFQLTSGKTAANVKLPNNRNVVFLAIGLGGGGGNGTAITPYVWYNGTWYQTNTASVTPGTAVDLGPQPISGGSWRWSGPNGFSSSSRQINNIPLSLGMNTFVATYTNTSGALSYETFNITVSGWSQIGVNVDSLGCASDGTLVVANNQTGSLWEYLSGRWSQLPGSGKHIRAGSANNIWGIGFDNNVYHLVNGNWQEVGTNVSDLAVGADGTVLVVNASNYSIWKYNGPYNWTQIPGGATSVSVVQNNNYFVVGGGNVIWQYYNGSWAEVGSNMLYVRAASDGTVLGTTSSGQIWRYVSPWNWVQVPGSVAVASPVKSGGYFAIGRDNNVYAFGNP